MRNLIVGFRKLKKKGVCLDVSIKGNIWLCVEIGNWVSREYPFLKLSESYSEVGANEAVRLWYFDEVRVNNMFNYV